MSDGWAVALAAFAAAGAARPSALPLIVGIVGVVAAFALRRPAVLCLGVAALVSALAGRSLAGLDDVVAGPVDAEVLLLSDPVPTFGGLRADARLAGTHVELRADGVAADALRPRLAGERLRLRGDLSSAPGEWLVARHVAGRLRVYAVEGWRPGGLAARAANGLRRTLVRGAASLDADERSLYTGLVIGDDRAQSTALADDFLGAGLTHLLAVSGQNVAFVLTLAGPLLRRLRLWPRLAATLAVIAMFGVITRFEPSVLRAAAMAALATATTTVGSPVSRLRILALAVTGLLVVDPLLVRSVGFQLSAAAATAIVLAAPSLAAALPGPGVLREAMAVTVAAQVGVAPVLLATFGPLPVASFPANLLAVPAAGPVMVWGLTGGIAAGVLGGWAAAILHLPTRALLAWLAEVAQRSSRMPLGELRTAHLAVFAVGLAGALVGRHLVRGRGEAIRRAGLVMATASVAVAVVAAQAPPPLREGLAPGLVRWHAEHTEVIVLGGAGGRSQLGASTALAALRAAGVGSIDLLVLADGSVIDGVVTAVALRHPIGTVLVAGDGRGFRVDAPVMAAPRTAARLDVGALTVRVTPTTDRLVVEAGPRLPP